MSPAALGLAWALSVASLSVSFPVQSAEGMLSRTMLCALGWIALAGLPRGGAVAQKTGDESASAWWRFYAFMVPVLAVALGFDYAAGCEPLALVRLAVITLTLTGVFARSADVSRGSAGHACLWALLIPLPFVLAVLPQGGGEESSLLQSVLAATPAGWTMRELIVEARPAWERDWGLVLSTALFFVVSFLLARKQVQS